MVHPPLAPPPKLSVRLTLMAATHLERILDDLHPNLLVKVGRLFLDRHQGLAGMQQCGAAPGHNALFYGSLGRVQRIWQGKEEGEGGQTVLNR